MILNKGKQKYKQIIVLNSFHILSLGFEKEMRAARWGNRYNQRFSVPHFPSVQVAG